MDFCEKATEHDLSPSEAARRYCLRGFTFASPIWGTVRCGGTVGEGARLAGRAGWVDTIRFKMRVAGKEILVWRTRYRFRRAGSVMARS